MFNFDEVMVAVENNREEIIDKLVKFSITDMMLFWGDRKEIVERQKQIWNPILEWCQQVLETELIVTQTLDVPCQSQDSGVRIRLFLNNLSNKELSAFYVAALSMKSVLLASALIKGRVNAEQAFEAANLEEIWQNEQWGVEEDAENRRLEMKKELEAIEAFLKS